jgi:hypothetical protein
MNVRTEIERYAADSDKAVLLWLFERYHLASQWRFVAKCEFVSTGVQSYQSRRVWSPTYEGRALYEHAQLAAAFRPETKK